MQTSLIVTLFLVALVSSPRSASAQDLDESVVPADVERELVREDRPDDDGVSPVGEEAHQEQLSETEVDTDAEPAPEAKPAPLAPPPASASHAELRNVGETIFQIGSVPAVLLALGAAGMGALQEIGVTIDLPDEVTVPLIAITLTTAGLLALGGILMSIQDPQD